MAFKLCIILNSGSYARAHEALAIANVVAARGGEVRILFSYAGLRRVVKGRTDEIDPCADARSEEALAEEAFRRLIERGAVEPISEMMEMGLRLGALSLYACPGAMSIMGISKEALIDEVSDITGLVQFMDYVMASDQTIYV